MTTRDKRRADRKRYRDKVLRTLKTFWRSRELVKDETMVGRYTNHGLKLCSCRGMCDNPRHRDGPPVKELRRAAKVEPEEEE